MHRAGQHYLAVRRAGRINIDCGQVIWSFFVCNDCWHIQQRLSWALHSFLQISFWRYVRGLRRYKKGMQREQHCGLLVCAGQLLSEQGLTYSHGSECHTTVPITAGHATRLLRKAHQCGFSHAARPTKGVAYPGPSQQ